MVYGTHRAYGTDGAATSSFRDLDLVVEASARSLESHLGEFDGIVVTGISGLSVGAPLALRLQKPLLVVRKQGESSHGTPGELIGAEKACTRLLFVDDFISLGNTLRRVEESVANAQTYAPPGVYEPYEGRVVATYEYRCDSWSDDRYAVLS